LTAYNDKLASTHLQNVVSVSMSEVQMYAGNDTSNHRLQSANNYLSGGADVGGMTGGSAGCAMARGDAQLCGAAGTAFGAVGAVVGWVKGLFENDYGDEAK
jgi:hypothetical protein